MIYVQEIMSMPTYDPTAEIKLIVTGEHIQGFIDAFSNNGMLDGKALLKAFGLKSVDDKIEMPAAPGRRAIDI